MFGQPAWGALRRKLRQRRDSEMDSTLGTGMPGLDDEGVGGVDGSH